MMVVLKALVGLFSWKAWLIGIVLTGGALYGVYWWITDSAYDSGYASATEKYERLMADEKARQQRIADEALAEAQKRVFELIERNHDLQMKLKENEHAAEQDPDADRTALGSDSVQRIDRIR